MKQAVVLVAKAVRFGSSFDEAAFFSWLKKIEGIIYKGVGDELQIEVNFDNFSENSLRELIAIFSRYNIDMGQLRVLVDDSNRRWVVNPHAYWYKSMFEG
jgi:hypothetical protein